MKTASTVAALVSTLMFAPLYADEAADRTVEDLYKQRNELSGQQVRLHGRVVKVNNQIMQRNFLHLQDGTGNPADGSNDVTVTSQDTAAVGDEVTVSGTLVVDQDFGYGYTYPVLVEKASVTKSH